MKRLDNRIALVTGAGAGIGRETARVFAGEGATVYLADIDATAVESGAKIVHCCGFDSIPSDLGVWLLHRELGAMQSARLYVTRMKGGFSGGTFHSMLDIMEAASRDPELRRLLVDPYALNPEGERQGPDRGDQRNARTIEGRHTAPFIMAAINTRIVRRSNALLDYAYGREFRYSEAMQLPTEKAAKRLARASKWGMIGAALTPTRALMRRFGPAPGSGPSREERENGRFRIEIVGEAERRAIAQVGADADPGYGATAKMLAESALCLAIDRPAGPGGILTPAASMAAPLIERLRAAGMTFELDADAR